MVARIRNWMFLGLLLVGGVTFFTRNRLSSVENICPECLSEPLQTATTNSPTLKFDRGGYRYEATPLFDYRISGLVVHKLDYSWFSIDRSETAFPVDLCIIWGDNLRNGIHRERSVQFSQDCRFCFAQWHGNVPFNVNQLSNNHLLTGDASIEARLKQIRAGDQVTLRGKLVNVSARLLDKPGRYDSDSLTWKTSTTRTDSGPGACEVIYVEAVEILQPTNVWSRRLFPASLCGLGLLALWWLVDLVRP